MRFNHPTVGGVSYFLIHYIIGVDSWWLWQMPSIIMNHHRSPLWTINHLLYLPADCTSNQVCRSFAAVRSLRGNLRELRKANMVETSRWTKIMNEAHSGINVMKTRNLSACPHAMCSWAGDCTRHCTWHIIDRPAHWEFGTQPTQLFKNLCVVTCSKITIIRSLSLRATAWFP